MSKKRLREFWLKNRDSEQQLKSWFREAEKASWPSANFVKDEFPNSRLIAGKRVIFNIHGNKYNLIVKVNYNYGMVWIRFIGTHEEYEKIDPITI